MNKKLFSIAILILAAVIIVTNIWNPLQSEENKDLSKEDNISASKDIPGADLTEILEGKPAPDFELATLGGKNVKLSDYKGKTVILNFWATWCPPCKAEMPHMQNFYEKHSDKGIEILAVNLTSADKGIKTIENFVKDYGLTFPILLDEKGLIGPQYQAFTVPTSYIIDANGIIAKKIVGPMDENMMVNLTNSIE